MKLTESKKSEISVYKTRDYELFELIKSNRPIYPHHLGKLIKMIKEDNRLKQNPIRVTQDGKVLDGQHRLEAARKLNVPIYYFIVEDSKEDVPDIAMENWATKKWTNKDHLNYWASKGKEHYIAVRDFLEHRPWVTTSTALAICAGNLASAHLGAKARENFAMGRYEVTDMAYACKVASAVSDFGAYVNFYRHKPFTGAVSHLVKLPDYDHGKMMVQMERAGYLLDMSVNRMEYLRKLETIYNHGKRRDNRVRFF